MARAVELGVEVTLSQRGVQQKEFIPQRGETVSILDASSMAASVLQREPEVQSVQVGWKIKKGKETKFLPASGVRTRNR